MGKKGQNKPGTQPRQAPEKPAPAPASRSVVARTFKMTYIGDQGIFMAGETCLLTREQLEILADDLE